MQVQVSLTIEIEATASISQMEQRIQEAGQQAMREALKQAIRHWEDQHRSCPCCSHKQRRLEGTVRRTIAATFGRVQVARRRFRCQRCWHRWCPANALFNELKGATISQPLREAAMLAGCRLSLSRGEQPAQATEWGANQCGRDPSADQPGGKLRATQQQEEAERACSLTTQQASSAQKVEQPVLVGLDGGWVCSRDQRGGMEGKVGVVC